jgi:hypothetical protein
MSQRIVIYEVLPVPRRPHCLLASGAMRCGGNACNCVNQRSGLRLRIRPLATSCLPHSGGGAHAACCSDFA